MFEDLMGSISAKQEEMKANLKEMKIMHTSQDGMINVTVNANREVLNIDIDGSLIADGDKEQIEDLLIITLNEALNKAVIAEQDASQKLLSEMTPPGLGNLFGL